MAADSTRRLIVAMTGATGTIYGVRLLQALKQADVETHFVMSKWGARTLVHETPFTVEQVNGLAAEVHAVGDLGAPISSGSFVTLGMIVAPCSMRTLAAIAGGVRGNLIHRAADVVLKEGRRLVLAVQETPLSAIHLENMLKLARLGVAIGPPVPAFYNRPSTLDDVVNYTVARLLDQAGIHIEAAARWEGMKTER